ncbi:hypothetical protein JCM10207_001115 [Rhodosporidiobolus poonsookiae]
MPTSTTVPPHVAPHPQRPSSLDALALNNPGHSVQPELVRESSALQHLATTLKTWAPFDPTAPLSPASPASPADVRANRAAVHHEDRFVGDDNFDACPPPETPSESVKLPQPDLGEKVAWTRWDELEDDGKEPARRILILGYKSKGVAVWDCSSLDTWAELLNLPTFDEALDDKLRRKFPRGVGTVSSGAVLASPLSKRDNQDLHLANRPLLAFSTYIASASPASSTVFLYSLRNHRIIDSFSVPGIATRILTTPGHLVVSTTSPPALHLFRAADLAPLPFSPITDVARSPHDGAPVFDLGPGGRLLAYATDRPLLSSRLDRAPAKPGAGILAHRGLFDADPSSTAEGGAAGDFRFAAEAAQAGGEVARKVGEGVLSGVKAIGEAGRSYWMGRRTSEHDMASAGATVGEDGSRTFSKSAPAPVGAGFGRRLSLSAMTKVSGEGAAGSAAAGTVVVVDLLSYKPTATSAKMRGRTVSSGATPSSSSAAPPLKVVAHFRPYAQPLALLSFSPSSSQLLTAPASGHAFDVFELKPSVAVGTSATASAASSPSPAGAVGQVWHRYRLHRGYTSAHASAAAWTPEGRFVAVSTTKGTAHVYALCPTGGAPNLEEHFSLQVQNARELAPLSVALGAVARVRAPSTQQQQGDGLTSPALSRGPSQTHSAASSAVERTSTFPSVVFLPPSASLSSTFRPAPASSGSRRALPAQQDLLTLHPSSGLATLHRLSPAEAPPPPLATLASAAEGAVAAASRGDVGRLATTAVSGLSQLMRRGAAAAGAGAGGVGAAEERKREGEGRRQWAVRGETLAGWRLARERGWGVVKEVVGSEGGESSGEEESFCDWFGARRYSAFAEIETFSRSPLVLPRSIYSSQQFEFFALPPNHASLTKKGNFALPLRRLEMRSEVRIREGDAVVSSDVPSSSSTSPVLSGRHISPRLAASYTSSASFEPASFDAPIRTAMQTFLDNESMLAPGSPKPAPSFPVGVPGKHGSWRDTARHVAPAALEGIGKVRQGLGRVRIPSVPAGMIPLGRNKPSTGAAAAGAGVAYSSSLSFEDDDAVFAERMTADDAASAGTACTSEIDDALGAKMAAGSGADEDWGWDDRLDEDEPARPAVASSVATPSSGALETFEEDFDDFDLELPGASPSKTHSHAQPHALALAAPSPLALDPVDAAASSPRSVPAPSGLPRHLAPPVDGGSLPYSSSPASLGAASSAFDTLSGSSPYANPLLADLAAPPRLPSLGSSPTLLDRAGALGISGNGIGTAAPANTIRCASPALSSGSSAGGKKKKKR